MTRQIISPTDSMAQVTAKAQANFDELYATAPTFPNQPQLVTTNPAPGANDVRFRAPLTGDDSTKGYAVNDYWFNQTTAKLFRATDVTAGAAVWADVTPTVGVLPYDALVASGGAAQGVYATRRVVAAYAGAAIRVRKDDDKTESDIGFTSSGEFDFAALTAFAGTVAIPSVSPSNVSIKTWYDQSGAGNHATAPTETATAQWPKLHAEQLVGTSPAIQFENLYQGGQTSKTNEYLVLPSGITGTQTSATIFAVARTPSLNRVSAIAQIGVTASTAAFAVQAYTGSGLGDVCLTGNFGKIGSGKLPMVNAAVYGGIAASGTNASSVRYNGTTTTATITGTTALTGGYVGAVGTSAATRGNAEIGLTMVASTAWTSAQWDAAERAAIVLYRLAPQVRDVLVIDGDSFVDGQRSTYNRTMSRRMEAGMLARPFCVYNAGTSGDSLGTSTSGRVQKYPNLGGTAYRAGALNVFLSQASTNDISAQMVQWTPGYNLGVGLWYYNYGRFYVVKTAGNAAFDTGPVGTGTGIVSGAATYDYVTSDPAVMAQIVYTRMQTLVGLAQTTGYSKRLVVTSHPRGDRDTTLKAVETALIALIRANTIGVDAVIDTAGDVHADTSDRTYFFTDATHPLDAMQDRMARMYAYQVNAQAPAT